MLRKKCPVVQTKMEYLIVTEKKASQGRRERPSSCSQKIAKSQKKIFENDNVAK